ncbi:MAG: nucleoside triphosphate pyrophosphohydrolase [Nitrospinota bacterium]|nr:nucleoside triphosphate pyrophosphohydrolase [Nitrospinota bacterium]
MKKETDPLKRVIQVMSKLRSDDGCPWDMKQDHESLKPYLIEEVYEVIEAIDSSDPELLKEELGDLFLQVVFHSQIASEKGKFDMFDVVDFLSKKLIDRHPHVFKELKENNANTILQNWEVKKRNERNSKKEKNSILDGVPKSMPGLQQAERLQDKASRVGFDWKDSEGPENKIKEELVELKKAIGLQDRRTIENELGDLLFSVVNLARKLGLNAEESIKKSSIKFTKRFHYIEEKLDEEGLSPEKVSIEKLENLWDESKNKI